MHPHFFDGAKKRRYSRQRNALHPCCRSRVNCPLKGTKRTTERTAIPNPDRRRSGSATVFILDYRLGYIAEDIIEIYRMAKQDEKILCVLMHPHFFDGAKKRRYSRQRNALHPCCRSRVNCPLKGTKRTTERTAIPNPDRRRSGSATVFILDYRLGYIAEDIIEIYRMAKQDEKILCVLMHPHLNGVFISDLLPGFEMKKSTD